jgi:ATP-dependent protease HslVU (ClpYQ) peptidase subunit
MQEIVDGVKGATASSLKMLSGLEQLAKNNFDNLKENEAIEVNKILKDNSVFENLNKAKKDLENLLGGK